MRELDDFVIIVWINRRIVAVKKRVNGIVKQQTILNIVGGSSSIRLNGGPAAVIMVIPVSFLYRWKDMCSL